MSQYNPDFYEKNRLSVRLADMAKDRLDALDRPDLKKTLDQALFGNDSPPPAVHLGDDSKGLIV